MTSHEAEKVIFQSHEQLEAVTVIVWVYTLEGGRTHAHVYHGGTEIFHGSNFLLKDGTLDLLVSYPRSYRITYHTCLVVVIVSIFHT